MTDNVLASKLLCIHLRLICVLIRVHLRLRIFLLAAVKSRQTNDFRQSCEPVQAIASSAPIPKEGDSALPPCADRVLR